MPDREEDDDNDADDDGELDGGSGALRHVVPWTAAVGSGVGERAASGLGVERAVGAGRGRGVVLLLMLHGSCVGRVRKSRRSEIGGVRVCHC